MRIQTFLIKLFVGFYKHCIPLVGEQQRSAKTVTVFELCVEYMWFLFIVTCLSVTLFFGTKLITGGIGLPFEMCLLIIASGAGTLTYIHRKLISMVSVSSFFNKRLKL